MNRQPYGNQNEPSKTLLPKELRHDEHDEEVPASDTWLRKTKEISSMKAKKSDRKHTVTTERAQR